MNETTVKVSNFTLIPGPRFRASGDNSAQEFYEEYIRPQLQKIKRGKTSTLVIDFSGTWGYPPSFTSQLGIYLKEYLGSYEVVKAKIRTATDNPLYTKQFWEQLKDESA